MKLKQNKKYKAPRVKYKKPPSKFKRKNTTGEDFDYFENRGASGKEIPKKVKRKKIPYINSKGEKLIAESLTLMGIEFEREKVFQDCINPKSGLNLRFDFYLPNNNTLIEFDGMQHFKVCALNVDEEGLKRQIEKDRFKDVYSLNKNIRLLRIKYNKMSKIPFILKNFLGV